MSGISRRGFMGGMGAMLGILAAGAKIKPINGSIITNLGTGASTDIAPITQPEIVRWFTPERMISLNLTRDAIGPIDDGDGFARYQPGQLRWDCVFEDSGLGFDAFEGGDPIWLRIINPNRRSDMVHEGMARVRSLEVFNYIGDMTIFRYNVIGIGMLTTRHV